MPIKVYYELKLQSLEKLNKLGHKNKLSALNEFKKEFLRDISWGTHTPSLTSVDYSLNNQGITLIRSLSKRSSISDYKRLQPEFEPANFYPKDVEVTYINFTVTFKDEQFDFATEGVNHFVATVAGDVIKNNKVDELVLKTFELIEFDTSIFLGPLFGIQELKKHFSQTLKKKTRPILAFSIKPRIGLSISDYKVIAEDAAKEEIDIIEDDERLVDPKYCSFVDRVNVINKLIKKGYKSRFSVNLTSNPFQMGQNPSLKDKLHLAYNAGIRVVKLDVIASGFDALLYLRHLTDEISQNSGDKIAITVFPDVTGKNYRGLSKDFVLKLSRLCGADIIYAANPILNTRIDNVENLDDLNQALNKVKEHQEVLTKPLIEGNYKECLPTMTHDLHPANVEIITYLMRCKFQNYMDFAFFIGGGISGFPCKKFKISSVIKLLKNILIHASEQDLSICDNDYKNISKLKYYSINTEVEECLEKNKWTRYIKF